MNKTGEEENAIILDPAVIQWRCREMYASNKHPR
jgi:hypothetical protein